MRLPIWSVSMGHSGTRSKQSSIRYERIWSFSGAIQTRGRKPESLRWSLERSNQSAASGAGGKVSISKE
jgi:hypothetical protein